MKRFTIGIMFASILLLTLGNAVSAQDVEKIKFPSLNKFSIPEVEDHTLDNGLRLYLIEDNTLPLVRISVRINCGEWLEPSDKVGLANICGEVLRTGGTEKYTGDEIDEMLEGVGASVETSIGSTSGSASGSFLSEYTDMGLEVLAEILRRPQFSEDKIDLAKVSARSGISRRNDDPMQVAVREFMKTIYGPDSYLARQTEYASVNAIERDDLVKFHTNYIQPQNIQIAIWGDIDRNTTIEMVRKYFGDWPKGTVDVPPLPEVDYQYDKQVYMAEKSDVNQSTILIGHIGGLITDEDYPARIVMNNIFGSSFGSRLFNNVRSKEGLAYAASGTYTANPTYPGVFYAFTSTKSETTVKAAKEVIKVIESMQTEPPTEEEMRKGTEGYLNSFVFNFDSKGEVINRMMNYDFYGIPREFLFDIKNKVEKVKPEDVVAAAKKNLHPENLHVMVVGKGEDFDMPLDQAGLGPVTQLDISIPPPPQDEPELALTPENFEKGKVLLMKAVEAHGGVKKYQAITSIKSKGQFTIVTPNGDFPLPFESSKILPDKSYEVVSLMGNKIFDIRNGDEGWKTSQQTMELVAKSAEDLAKDREQERRSTIAIFRKADKPDYKAVFDGQKEMDGVSVMFIALLGEDGKPFCRLGVNPTTNMLYCKSYWGETPMGEGQVLETYSAYGVVSGVQIPMTSTRSMNGSKTGQVTFSEYVINADIDPTMFQQP